MDPNSETRPVVLVVEDDKTIQTSIARFLTHFGYRAMVADSVPAAIQLAKSEHVGAVTLDLTLPGASGIDFLLWLRNTPRYSGTPVVVLTGNAALRPDHGAVLRSMGASVLFKPAPYQAVLDQLLLAYGRGAAVRG